MKPTTSSLISVHLAVLLFGLAGLFGKWTHVSAEMLVLGRTFFASIFLAWLSLLFKNHLSYVKPPFSWYVILPGLILIVHWYTFFKAIQLSTVAIGLLGYSTFPIFVYMLEILFLKSKFTLVKAGYVFLAFIGVVFLFPESMKQAANLKGLLYAILSGFTFAVLALLNKKLVKEISSLSIAFYQDLIAAIVLLILFYNQVPLLKPFQWFQLALLGVFCTALAHTLYIQGMKHLSASSASVIALLEPVYGILLAILLFKETMSWNYVLGGALILMGGYGMFGLEEK
jgi:drug/metabolite transporter (DMT)-like permease